MLRITELRLPLDHPEEDLRKAVVTRLGVAPADLLSFAVFRRAWDARKKSAIKLVYTIDAEVRDEAAVPARCAKWRRRCASSDSIRPWQRRPPRVFSGAPISA